MDFGIVDQRPEQSERRGLQLENASRRCLADYGRVMPVRLRTGRSLDLAYRLGGMRVEGVRPVRFQV